MGILLYIVSFILKRILLTFSITYTFLRLLVLFEFKAIDRYFFRLAIGNDQLGNIACSYLFNDIMRRKGGYRFGNEDETISSVVGKLERDDKLSFLGHLLNNILELFEENHSAKSIEEDEGGSN